LDQEYAAEWQNVTAGSRMTAADNGGQIASSLKDLSVPGPVDPATYRPFEYELNGDVATIRGARINSLEHHIILELAEQNQKENENAE